MNAIVIWIALYVMAQVGLGIWLSRYVRTSADFMVAGRALGPILLSCAVFATFFGAEAIVGTAGAVYEKGLSGAQADPIGYTIALLVIGIVFAGRLRGMGLTTFADLFRARYSPRVEKLVVLILLPGSIFWAAAQLRAFGQVLSAASGIGFATVLVIGAVTVVLYSALGGILADAWSDLLHSFVIFAGLMALLIAVAGSAGGLGAALSAVPAERLQAFALGEEGLIGFIERMAIPIFGTIVAVEVISLLLSSRSPGAARTGSMVGAAIYLLISGIPVAIGLVAPAIMPDLKDAEQVIPLLAEKLLGRPAYVLFIGAIVAAILSTVSTIFLASSSQVIHNIVKPMQPTLDDAGQLRAARVMLVILGVVAALLALTSDKVKSLVEIASAAGSSGVFAVLMFGLFTKLGGERSAIAALVVGTVSWAALGPGLGFAAPYVTAIVLAVVTYAAVAVGERRFVLQGK